MTTAISELPPAVYDFLSRLSARYWSMNDLGIITVTELDVGKDRINIEGKRLIESMSGEIFTNPYGVSIDLAGSNVKKVRTDERDPITKRGYIEDIVYGHSNEHVDVRYLQDLFCKAEGDYRQSSVSAIHLINSRKILRKLFRSLLLSRRWGTITMSMD